MNYVIICQISYEAEVNVEANSEAEARRKVTGLDVPLSEFEPVDPSEIQVEIEEVTEEL